MALYIILALIVIVLLTAAFTQGWLPPISKSIEHEIVVAPKPASPIPVANALIIKDGKVLLVYKRDVWILPGGKIEWNEDARTCLIREIGEELPGYESFVIHGRLGEFSGVSPHQQQPILVEVFLATAHLRKFVTILYGAEITAAEYFSREDFEEIKLSATTQSILRHAVAQGHIS